MRLRDLATHRVRALLATSGLSDQRAQERPGACCTRGLVLKANQFAVDSNVQTERITASTSNPAKSNSPASRLDLNIRRHNAGSLMSNRLICQTRCAANAISPIHAAQRAPPNTSAAPISITASE